MAPRYSGNRLEKFVERHGFYIPVATNREDDESSEGDEEDSKGSEDVGEIEDVGMEDSLVTQPRRSSSPQQKPRIHWVTVNQQGGLPS